MSILAFWTDKLNTIAAANASCRQNVFRMRDAGSHGLGSELAGSLIAKHSSPAVQALQDYVVYLIWSKLTQRFSGGPTDPFLGVTDLREYLLTRDPGRRPQYVPKDVDALLASQVAETYLGDLRAWLCARQGVRSQLYSHDELDMYLRQLDIEELRRHPPETVANHIKKIYSMRRDRAKEFRRFRDKGDRELANLLPRGVPLRIRQWAFVITHQLIAGACDCPEVYSLVTAAAPRVASQAETRCRYYHFLCEENVEESSHKKLAHQKRATKDVLEYVERAVIERISLRLSKTFANTMLCNLFFTPGENPLRMKDHHGKKVLTEAGREFVVDEETLDRCQTVVPVHPCLGCATCHWFVGEPASVKQCQGHPLLYGTAEPSNTDGGQYHSVSVSVCQADHVWLGKGQCPVCTQTARLQRRRIEIYVPAEIRFETIEWQWKLPRSCTRRTL